jgi:hypothetical protein
MDEQARCVICSEHDPSTLFVAGPSGTVCAMCVLSAVSLLLRGNLATAEPMAPAQRQEHPHCSFCGKVTADAPALIGYAGVALCPECLGKSVELMATRAFERAEHKALLAIPPHGP